ncbi:60S ribosomal protein L18a-1 [Raphanus sativus]|nr:60S ribosomal protein L18a-1 [Raphanus sativus]
MLAISEIVEKNQPPRRSTTMVSGCFTRAELGTTTCTRSSVNTTLNGAVEPMYTEMASRHRVRFPCIQIIKTATVSASLSKRESTKQFHNSKIKFPLVFRKVRPLTRKLKTTYKASKAQSFM